MQEEIKKMSGNISRLEVLINQLSLDMKAGFQDVGAKFGQLNIRLDDLIEGLATAVSHGFDGVEAQFKEVKIRLDRLETVREPF